MAYSAANALFLQMLENSLGKGHTAVLSARAAERNDKLALALAVIKRNEEVDKVGELFQQLLDWSNCIT